MKWYEFIHGKDLDRLMIGFISPATLFFFDSPYHALGIFLGSLFIKSNLFLQHLYLLMIVMGTNSSIENFYLQHLCLIPILQRQWGLYSDITWVPGLTSTLILKATTLLLANALRNHFMFFWTAVTIFLPVYFDMWGLKYINKILQETNGLFISNNLNIQPYENGVIFQDQQYLLVLGSNVRLIRNIREIQTEERCSICLDAKTEFSLSCEHAFCLKCIGKWVCRSTTCPLCRTNI